MNKKGYFYIDTLYLYLDVSRETYNNKLLDIVNKSKHLGVSNGYTYYKWGYIRIGIINDYENTIKANQYPFIIQFEHSYLFRNAPEIENISIPLFDDVDFYKKIKRIDLTYTVKNGLKLYDRLLYIPISKKSINYVSDTLYIGKRTAGEVLRVYNKSKELRESKNEAKIKEYREVFGNIDNLVTYELELHNKVIRMLKGFKFEYKYLKNFFFKRVKEIVYFVINNDDNRKRILNKNYKRLTSKLYIEPVNDDIEDIEYLKLIYLSTPTLEYAKRETDKLIRNYASKVNRKPKDCYYDFIADVMIDNRLSIDELIRVLILRKSRP